MRHDGRARLSVTWDRPPDRVDNDYIVEYRPGPRSTVTIEGEHELVEPIGALVHKYLRENSERLGLDRMGVRL